MAWLCPVLGERSQEMIDGQVPSGLARFGPQVPVRHAQAHARRDDVDVIGLCSGVSASTSRTGILVALERRSVSWLWLLRVKVLNQHKRHAGIGRQVFEKRRERFQAACRCADADNRKGY